MIASCQAAVRLSVVTTAFVGLSPLAAAEQTGLIAHWVFDESNLTQQSFADLAGRNAATITGPIVFRTDGEAHAVLVDGDRNRVTASSNADAVATPKSAITVEAWVAVEKTVEWGGIVGQIQGNKGWLLGFRQSSFSFGVSGRDSDGLTHVRARHSLVPGRWYHVAGTYDGQTIRLYVDGQLEAESAAQSGDINDAAGREYVIGSFESFHPRLWVHAVRIYDRAVSKVVLAERARTERSSFARLLKLKLAPTLERLNHHTLRLSWESADPMPTVLTFGDTVSLRRRFVDADAKSEHVVTIDDIETQRMYFYRILADSSDRPAASTQLYEFDATFDYTRPTVEAAGTDCGREYKTFVQKALAELDATRGYALIVGPARVGLACALAAACELQIVWIDDDASRVASARRELDARGLYGVRASVQKASLTQLPLSDYLANLIVSDPFESPDPTRASAKELYRVLRPCGGVAYLGRATNGAESSDLPVNRVESWLDGAAIPKHERTVARDATGVWAVVRRGPLPEAGDWSHQYGEPGNSSSSGDAYVKSDMRVLWFGRPGPRPMVDRGTRPPAPLSVNGRLFVQGDRRLFGLDAYNGTILWVLEIPDLRRANVPRDSSNMAATDDALYVAVRDHCWVLDAGTGRRRAAFRVPVDAAHAGEFDWGYVAVIGDVLYGSAVRRGGTFIGADGEWYDKANEESHKVVSDRIFAMDRSTGRQLWAYDGDGPVINSAVCMGDGRMFLIESRSEDAKRAAAGRLGSEVATDHYMVALNQSTGEKVWEQYYPFHEGRYVFYLSYARDTLVALSTTDRYHIYAFDADKGRPLWQQSYDFHRDHHGGAMQHPVVVGETVFAEPKAFSLRTGEPVAVKMTGRGGCGAMTASAGALFFRDGYHSMWDLASDTRKRFTGMRPGCWIGIIPAGGVLLAPETSAGCYCAQPIQSSIAFVPVRNNVESTQP